MSERSGVEIDYCPQCRGVWLDRGELDKIIDRVNEAMGGSGSNATPPGSRGSRLRFRRRCIRTLNRAASSRGMSSRATTTGNTMTEIRQAGL